MFASISLNYSLSVVETKRIIIKVSMYTIRGSNLVIFMFAYLLNGGQLLKGKNLLLVGANSSL